MSGFSHFMAYGGWAVFSVIAAVFSAGFYLVNQYLKQPGHALVFWSRVLTVVAMTPFMTQVDFPAAPGFYGIVALTVVFGIGADIRTFNSTALFGGGVVSRLMPATVWGAFFLWLVLHPSLLLTYAGHPWNTAGILLALGGCVWFAMRLNKCEVTRNAAIHMLPAVAGYTITTVLNKMAMQHGDAETSFAGVVYAYMYVQSCLAVLVLGPYVVFREKRRADKGAQLWRHDTMLAAALLAMLVWVCHMIYKNYAMAYTPNPSYQGAVNLTAPVFVAIFYYFAGHKEKADVMSGMGIVACAILLALLTLQPQ